jgi:hypothetical protein
VLLVSPVSPTYQTWPNLLSTVEEDDDTEHHNFFPTWDKEKDLEPPTQWNIQPFSAYDSATYLNDIPSHHSSSSPPFFYSPHSASSSNIGEQEAFAEEDLSLLRHHQTLYSVLFAITMVLLQIPSGRHQI